MDLPLKAVITGASRGIGSAIAERFAAEGMDMLLTGRKGQALDKLAQALKKANVRVETLVADLEDPQQPARIIRETSKRLGGLDILINNAGTALEKPMRNTTEEEWDRMMQVNARAPYFLCQEALPHLMRSSRPVIVNISSVVGRKGYVNQSAYGASKHALAGFTKSMAREFHHYGIRVHLVSPGGVDTELVRKVRPDLNEEDLIKPAEIAELVSFLVTQRGNGVIDEINIARATNIPWS